MADTRTFQPYGGSIKPRTGPSIYGTPATAAPLAYNAPASTYNPRPVQTMPGTGATGAKPGKSIGYEGTGSAYQTGYGFTPAQNQHPGETGGGKVASAGHGPIIHGGASGAVSMADINAPTMAHLNANSGDYLKSHGLQGRSINAPQGYGAGGNNMPVGVVGGNQVYHYGLFSNSTGGKTFLADPNGGEFKFKGTTANADFTLANAAQRKQLNKQGIKQLGTMQVGNDRTFGPGGSGSNGRGGGNSNGVRSNNGGVFGGGASGNVGTNLQNDLDEANRANEQRYQEALGINQTGTAGMLANLQGNYGAIGSQIDASGAAQAALVSGMGGTQHEQESRRLATQIGGQQQRLVGNGLGNSTITEAMRRGSETDSAFNQRAIDDELARLQLQIQQSTGQQKIQAMQQYSALQASMSQYGQSQRVGLIEGRQDLPPNIGQALQALGQPGAFGQPGGAQGGGGNNGGGNDAMEQLQAYLASLNGNQNTGGGFTPDPNTVAANERIIAKREQDQANRPAYNAGHGGTAIGTPNPAYNAGHSIYSGDPRNPISQSNYTDSNGDKYRTNSDGSWDYWDSTYGWVPTN